MKSTKQILYDEGFFDKYDNADETLKNDMLFDRHKTNLEERNDGFIHWLYSHIQFEK